MESYDPVNIKHELSTPMFEISETFQYHQDYNFFKSESDYPSYDPNAYDPPQYEANLYESTFADMYYRYLKQQNIGVVSAPLYEPIPRARSTSSTSTDRPDRDGKSPEPDRLYNCSMCTKVFKSKGSLKTHHLSHAAEKPHKCHVCGKTFSQKGNLKTHEIIHSGINPFACAICGRQFKQKGNLKTHQRTHSKPKLFQCHMCLKVFEHNRILKIHQMGCQQQSDRKISFT